MEHVYLSEIASLKAGGTPSRQKNEYWKNGNIPWLTITDIKGKHVSECKEYITDEGLNNSSVKIFKKGTLIYTIFATVGEVAFLDFDTTTNQAIANIELIDTRFSYEFLYYYLLAIKKSVLYDSKGVAQNNINLGYLKKLKIPVISLEEQKKIVSILDKINNIIDADKKQLELLDEVGKSRFIEMFGNPLSNNKGWIQMELQEIVTKDCTISYGIVQTGDEQNEGVPVFRPVDIVNNIPKRELLKKTTEEISNRYKKTILKGRELLITVRANIADVYVVGEEFKGCNVGRGITPIRTNEDLINLDFLKCQIENVEMNEYIKSLANGITLIQLNMSDLRTIKFIVPPMDKQLEFVAFSKLIDKSKFSVQKHLGLMEELLDKKMEDFLEEICR